MADESRIRPFSCGTDFMDWQDSNCAQCVASGGCALETAIALAYVGDGQMAKEAVVLIGCDGIWPKPCTLRHHKNDKSLTRDEVLARIDTALNPTAATRQEEK